MNDTELKSKKEHEVIAAKILEITGKPWLEYTPSDKEDEIISAIFEKFTGYADIRNQSLSNFDGLDLTRYIEDSYRRYTTNIDVRPDIEDWQSIVHDQVTRNKVNAVLSKIVAVMPIAEIQPRGDEDIRKAQIVNEIYQYSEEIDDYEEFMVRFLLEAIVKGTAIGYEGHQLKEVKVRNIVKGDGDSMTIKEDTKSTNKLFAEIVPLEEFFPENITMPRVKDLARCVRRRILPYNQFMSEYSSMFAKCQYVQPKISVEITQENRPYYLDYITSDIYEGYVEMLFYYDTDADEYIVLANGVWLNPLMIDDKEVVSPVPFNHKELPFFDIRFELFSADFFYGKSLPDKLKVFQDVLNVFTNMLIDQSILTIWQPILTNGFDSMEDDFLRPGRRTPIDTQGLPIRDAVMTLDMKTPGNWHQFILEYTKKVMEEASVDRVSAGQAGSGDRVTAQEIRIAAEGVSSLLGLFGRWVKYGIKRKCLLKTKNALQFWTDENMGITEGILGGGSSELFADAFKTFKIKNTTLSDGKRGTKVIMLYAGKDKMPTALQLKQHAAVQQVASGQTIEYVVVDAGYIRDIDFDIKLVVNQKSENTKDMEKAIMMEKVRVYLSFFPEMVNKQELLAQLAEKMGDDPTKIMSEDVLNQILAAGQGSQGNTMLDKGVSKNPMGDVMQNSMYKSMGHQVGIENIKNTMLG